MSLSLVVLAAGLGSRYGGLKQIDPIGPAGETVLDYAVFDALRAGFDRVVFVIRREFEVVFREQIGARYGSRMAVDYVFQSLAAVPAGFAVPAGREKPWGTGHAAWCAREALPGNFAVINADDFYGADSFAQLAQFLRGAQGPECAMVGFRMVNTLSEHGAVSRGVVGTAADGVTLRTIEERHDIARTEIGPGRKYTGQEYVSLNCWGFTPALWPGLEARWREFLRTRGHELKAEFYLPVAVSDLVTRGEMVGRVLPTESTWFGVTYREDKRRMQEAIAAMVRAGAYPPKLWT